MKGLVNQMVSGILARYVEKMTKDLPDDLQISLSSIEEIEKEIE